MHKYHSYKGFWYKNDSCVYGNIIQIEGVMKLTLTLLNLSLDDLNN